MPLSPMAVKAMNFAGRNAVPAFLATGATAGADMLSRPATGEPLSWLGTAGTFAASMAAARHPGLRKVVQPLAVSGSLLKGTDLLARHNTGYSPFDPKSVEQHMGQRFGRIADKAIDSTFAMTDVPQGISRRDFVKMVRQRMALRNEARQRVERLFSDA